METSYWIPSTDKLLSFDLDSIEPDAADGAMMIDVFGSTKYRKPISPTHTAYICTMYVCIATQQLGIKEVYMMV